MEGGMKETEGRGERRGQVAEAGDWDRPSLILELANVEWEILLEGAQFSDEQGTKELLPWRPAAPAATLALVSGGEGGRYCDLACFFGLLGRGFFDCFSVSIRLCLSWWRGIFFCLMIPCWHFLACHPSLYIVKRAVPKEMANLMAPSAMEGHPFVIQYLRSWYISPLKSNVLL